ncbi:MAG: hypothetical protein ACFB8W_20165 [Elainellaceae cyanobacterium]
MFNAMVPRLSRLLVAKLNALPLLLLSLLSRSSAPRAVLPSMWIRLISRVVQIWFTHCKKLPLNTGSFQFAEVL